MAEKSEQLMGKEELDALWAKIKSTFFASASFTQANIKSTLGISNWALESSKPSYAFSEITGTASSSQIPTLAISKIDGLQTALNNKLETSLKGAAYGLAELDANGLVPSSQLPSYVDDVLEYASTTVFPSTGVSGKIYVALDTNLTYRWSGTTYVEISKSLALGENSSTAYYGDKGKIAYDHATDASRLTTAKSSGFYKFATTAEGHIASVTAVAASDLNSIYGFTIAGTSGTTYNLDTIASNASNGNTAYGWGNHASAGYVKTVKVGTDSYSPTNGVVSLPAYPYAVSELVNDLGFTANTGTVTSVTIKGSGAIVVDYETAITGIGTRTISHATSGATAGSYGDSAAQTPAYGGTFKVPYVTVDAQGHVTAISEHTVKIPASDNTWRPLGTGANDACAGNDSRLSDARTPVAHASTGTGYGVGTTANYGHVKLATGDMNGASGADGVACGKNHTHSQYAVAANLGTASTHAHGDYVTAIGVSGNTLTWSKGGTAQTAITVPYATSAGNADTVDNLHASSFPQRKDLRSDIDSIYGLRFNFGQYDKGDYGGTYASEYPSYYGEYISLAYKDRNNAALLFVDCPINNALGHIYVRTRGAGDSNTSYSSLGTLAYISDNVASATQLQTSRSIWGQSFNGTADVSGAMSGVTTINGVVSFTNYGSSNPVLNIDTVYANTDYVSMYVTATHRPLVLQMNAGNVGIGVEQPSYKLMVAGDIYAQGGWLRTSGSNGSANGWQSQDYGGGWYCDDYTYVKTYGNRSIYTAADVLAGGNIVGTKGVASQGIANLSVAAISGSNYVTQVKIGSTAYNPLGGVVSLPAYPTVPTALSGFTNDVGYITNVTGNQVTNALGYVPAKKQASTETVTGNIYDAGGKAEVYDVWTPTGTTATFKLPYDPAHDIVNYVLVVNNLSSEITISFVPQVGTAHIIAPSNSLVVPAGKAIEVSYLTQLISSTETVVLSWSSAFSQYTIQ